jgi:hypothetical protein
MPEDATFASCAGNSDDDGYTIPTDEASGVELRLEEEDDIGVYEDVEYIVNDDDDNDDDVPRRFHGIPELPNFDEYFDV